MEKKYPNKKFFVSLSHVYYYDRIKKEYVKTDGIWIFFFVNSYMHKAKIVIVMCFK
jgi:hypothetical protein